jgi:flagellar hook-associated protein 1 FlgK
MALRLQNIKGANDPSYTRRSMESGVDPSGKLAPVVRIRDMFVDDQFRAANASVGDAATRKDIMNRIEDIFGDPTESGLGLAIDRFFDAFKAVSEDPADEVLRIEAIEAGRQFAQSVHEAMSQLTTIRGQVNENIENNVTQVNTLLENVRNLNSRIAVMKNSGESDADLQDQRDQVLDELSKLTGAVPTYLEDGTVRVMIGSVPAVDGITLHQLETVQGVIGPDVKWKDFTVPKFKGHGVLPALLDMRGQGIQDVIDTVDSLAKDVAAAVNAQHVKGFDQNGQPGQQFFLIQAQVPGGIYVDAGMTPAKIAAASTQLTDASGNKSVYQSDGTNADAIYQLSNGLQMIGGTTTPDKSTSPKNLYRNLVGLIGSRGQAAIQDEEIAQAHVKVSQEQRSSKWGVSIDEEMAMLTAETKAFAAVSRVMGVLDEMLETLINTAR